MRPTIAANHRIRRGPELVWAARMRVGSRDPGYRWRDSGMTVARWRDSGMTVGGWRDSGMTLVRCRDSGMTVVGWRDSGTTVVGWRDSGMTGNAFRGAADLVWAARMPVGSRDPGYRWRDSGMTVVRWHDSGMTLVRWRDSGRTVVGWRDSGMTLVRWRDSGMTVVVARFRDDGIARARRPCVSRRTFFHGCRIRCTLHINYCHDPRRHKSQLGMG